MLEVSNVSTWGFEGAIRGMRNPMNSWDKSDSRFLQNIHDYDICDWSHVGENDLALMKKLSKAGAEHRKYLRMIHVQMDIVAPMYWWSEFDTYKVGTTANSTSKMHRLTHKEFEKSDFSFEHLPETVLVDIILEALNDAEDVYNNFDEYLKKDELKEGINKKDVWYTILQLLPCSYNQRRTVDFNYETALNIIHQRSGHKLDEWHVLIDELKRLPYIEDLIDE